MNKLLEWMVFQAAVCYGRARWRGGSKPDERKLHDEHWNAVWAIQRELGCPPLGLIRSC